MKNVLKYFLLTNSEVRVVIVGVRADVDDAVHVEVEVVELNPIGVVLGRVHWGHNSIAIPPTLLQAFNNDRGVLPAQERIQYEQQ